MRAYKIIVTLVFKYYLNRIKKKITKWFLIVFNFLRKRDVIEFSLNMNSMKQNRSFKSSRFRYDKGDYSGMSSKLGSFDWSVELDLTSCDVWTYIRTTCWRRNSTDSSQGMLKTYYSSKYNFYSRVQRHTTVEL